MKQLVLPLLLLLASAWLPAGAQQQPKVPVNTQCSANGGTFKAQFDDDLRRYRDTVSLGGFRRHWTDMLGVLTEHDQGFLPMQVHDNSRLGKDRSPKDKQEFMASYPWTEPAPLMIDLDFAATEATEDPERGRFFRVPDRSGNNRDAWLLRDVQGRLQPWPLEESSAEQEALWRSPSSGSFSRSPAARLTVDCAARSHQVLVSAAPGAWVNGETGPGIPDPPGLRSHRPLLMYKQKSFTVEAVFKLPKPLTPGGEALPNGFSLAALVNLPSMREGEWIHHHNAWFLRLDTLGRLQFFLGAGDADFVPSITVVSSLKLADDRWHHVAAVFEAGRGVRLYVDYQLDQADFNVLPQDPSSRANYGLYVGQFESCVEEWPEGAAPATPEISRLRISENAMPPSAFLRPDEMAPDVAPGLTPRELESDPACSAALRPEHPPAVWCSEPFWLHDFEAHRASRWSLSVLAAGGCGAADGVPADFAAEIRENRRSRPSWQPPASSPAGFLGLALMRYNDSSLVAFRRLKECAPDRDWSPLEFRFEDQDVRAALERYSDAERSEGEPPRPQAFRVCAVNTFHSADRSQQADYFAFSFPKFRQEAEATSNVAGRCECLFEGGQPTAIGPLCEQTAERNCSSRGQVRMGEDELSGAVCECLPPWTGPGCTTEGACAAGPGQACAGHYCAPLAQPDGSMSLPLPVRMQELYLGQPGDAGNGWQEQPPPDFASMDSQCVCHSPTFDATQDCRACLPGLWGFECSYQCPHRPDPSGMQLFGAEPEPDKWVCSVLWRQRLPQAVTGPQPLRPEQICYGRGTCDAGPYGTGRCGCEPPYAGLDCQAKFSMTQVVALPPPAEVPPASNQTVQLSLLWQQEGLPGPTVWSYQVLRPAESFASEEDCVAEMGQAEGLPAADWRELTPAAGVEGPRLQVSLRMAQVDPPVDTGRPGLPGLNRLWLVAEPLPVEPPAGSRTQAAWVLVRLGARVGQVEIPWRSEVCVPQLLMFSPAGDGGRDPPDEDGGDSPKTELGDTLGGVVALVVAAFVLLALLSLAVFSWLGKDDEDDPRQQPQRAHRGRPPAAAAAHNTLRAQGGSRVEFEDVDLDDSPTAAAAPARAPGAWGWLRNTGDWLRLGLARGGGYAPLRPDTLASELELMADDPGMLGGEDEDGQDATDSDPSEPLRLGQKAVPPHSVTLMVPRAAAPGAKFSIVGDEEDPATAAAAAAKEGSAGRSALQIELPNFVGADLGFLDAGMGLDLDLAAGTGAADDHAGDAMVSALEVSEAAERMFADAAASASSGQLQLSADGIDPDFLFDSKFDL